MKRSRFSEEQIIGILKEHQIGFGQRSCAAVTETATRLSTNGEPSMAGWKCRVCGV
ncbi:hypothetical protein SAMN04488037_107229 [Shimia marina]|jgi:hypothetical protein|nr:hypothetical protein SAMN04488037_107229 [Shimia marina]